MKLTKITLNFDNGASAEYQDAKGLDIGDVFGGLGLTPESISEGAAGTLAGLIQTILTVGIGILMKRFGLSI